MQYVVFKINEEQFAVNSSNVQSINDIMVVTRVPKAPKFIKGLINLRGNIYSLLDLQGLLNLPANSLVIPENIIIMNTEKETIGIIVDYVIEVVDVNDEDIKKVEGVSTPNYIQGIIQLGDRIITLIDINRLIP